VKHNLEGKGGKESLRKETMERGWVGGGVTGEARKGRNGKESGGKEDHTGF
jgi:hypothetical protein